MRLTQQAYDALQGLVSDYQRHRRGLGDFERTTSGDVVFGLLFVGQRAARRRIAALDEAFERPAPKKQGRRKG